MEQDQSTGTSRARTEPGQVSAPPGSRIFSTSAARKSRRRAAHPPGPGGSRPNHRRGGLNPCNTETGSKSSRSMKEILKNGQQREFKKKRKKERKARMWTHPEKERRAAGKEVEIRSVSDEDPGRGSFSSSSGPAKPAAGEKTRSSVSSHLSPPRGGERREGGKEEGKRSDG